MAEDFNFCRELTATAVALAPRPPPGTGCPRCGNRTRFVRLVLPEPAFRAVLCDSG